MNANPTHHSRVEDPTTGIRTEFSEPTATGLGDIDGLAPGSAVLVVKRGPNAGLRFPLHQPVITAGRHPRSDIYLDDITVSRRHAEIRCDNGEFHLVDTASLNGTYLNHQPVDTATLTHGDEIQIGNYRLVFLTTTANSRPAGHPTMTSSAPM